MTGDPMIQAPFSPRQVEALNAFQASGQFHPFTCPTHSTLLPLEATPDGWVCPNGDCDYRQGWAHDFMADPATIASWPPLLIPRAEGRA